MNAGENLTGHTLCQHLAAIGLVAAQSWLGVDCPLTSLEMALRLKAQASTYDGGFIEFWLQRLLYVDAPPWVFMLADSVFVLLVSASWLLFSPHFKSSRRRPESP